MIEIVMRHPNGGAMGHIFRHPEADSFTVATDGDVCVKRNGETIAVYVNRTGDRITRARIVEPGDAE